MLFAVKCSSLVKFFPAGTPELADLQFATAGEARGIANSHTRAGAEPKHFLQVLFAAPPFAKCPARAGPGAGG